MLSSTTTSILQFCCWSVSCNFQGLCIDCAAGSNRDFFKKIDWNVIKGTYINFLQYDSSSSSKWATNHVYLQYSLIYELNNSLNRNIRRSLFGIDSPRIWWCNVDLLIGRGIRICAWKFKVTTKVWSWKCLRQFWFRVYAKTSGTKSRCL
jgi:hypothetical protein